jgi:hypothetical protein
MLVVLRDLSPGQDYALQFQSVGENGVSAWSQIYRFRTDGDVIPPAAPQNLIWRATGSSFLGTWDKVTTDGDGGPLKDFKDYEITVTATVLGAPVSKVFYVTEPTFELTLQQNADTFGTIAFTVQVDVRSRDNTLNKSAPTSATATEDTPPKPSTPTVSIYLGALQVSWDGNPATGVRNDLNLDHVEIHASTTNNFTPSTATLVGRFSGVFPGTQSQVITGLTYGSTYYIKLVAINRFNRAGVASDQATGTPIRITNLDITNGTISTAQINFTAFDIGGANAYYPATTTARDAIVGAKSGDIAYITGSGYATYRYNGTTWVAAPEIGVIQGSKILAGTVTSNAVGTNLLITAAANIADALIDTAKITDAAIATAKIADSAITNAKIATATITSAKIASLSADLITAGTISSTVVISGKFATASGTGARREMNAVGFQAFDSTNTLTINLDGVNNLLTGIFKTASTGRRIEIGAGGLLGEIDFYSASGKQAFVRAWSQSGTIEAAQFGLTVAGTDSLWNRINFNSSTAGTEYATMRSGTLELDFDSGTDQGSAGGAFYIFELSSKTSTVVPPAGLRYSLDRTSTRNIFPSGGTYSIEERDSSGTGWDRIYLEQNLITFLPGSPDFGWVELFPGGSPSFYYSPYYKFITPPVLPGTGRYGATLGYAVHADGTNSGIEIHNVNHDTFVWDYMKATDFLAQSDGQQKTNVVDAPDDFLTHVQRIKPKRYNRKLGKDKIGPEELGLIAQEAPVQIVGEGSNGDKMVSLYQMGTYTWGAVGQLADLVSKLQDRIKELEAKINEPKK